MAAPDLDLARLEERIAAARSRVPPRTYETDDVPDLRAVARRAGRHIAAGAATVADGVRAVDWAGGARRAGTVTARAARSRTLRRALAAVIALLATLAVVPAVIDVRDSAVPTLVGVGANAPLFALVLLLLAEVVLLAVLRAFVLGARRLFRPRTLSRGPR